MYADSLLEPWYRTLVEDLPGLEVLDVHTHLGENDPDGFVGAPGDLRDALALIDGRAAVFAMHEPGGYRAANERLIAEAAASEGRLFALCRLDPADDPIGDAERSLAAGACGVKLHPRAEGFRVDDPAVAGIFALAHERRLPVMIHAGRGIPALGRNVLELCSRFPDARAILAHAGISDLGWLWRETSSHPNLFFDTSWWNPSDLVALMTLVPPAQVLFASDSPYGTPLQNLVLTLRCALEAGLGADQVKSVAGAQAARLLAGEDPIDAGPAPGGPEARIDLLLDRVHVFLMSAIARILTGGGGEESLGLARLACEVGDDAPQAPVCRSVLALIERHDAFAGEARRIADDHGGEGRNFPGLHLLITAAGVARTPGVRVPDGVEPVSAGERSP